MKIYLLLAMASVVAGAWVGFETPADRLPEDFAAQNLAPSTEHAMVLEIEMNTTVRKAL